MSKIIVVGAGQAAATLAQTLRGEGYEGEIALYGDEPVPPYERPPLSKAYLLGEMEEERLYLRPRRIYEERGIDLNLGKPVTGLDTGAKTITVGGEDIAFDQLALTTGSVPNHLPASIGGDLDGVFTVRTLADIDRLAPRFTRNARLLVVGGGYIGLEAAAVATKLGVRVTLVELAERILGRVACAETADFVRALHMRHGVDLREGVGLEMLEGKHGHVVGARLDDGTHLNVDVVVVGTGIHPDTRLAEAAGIACDNGIAVDEFGQTSAEDVWAAGDCASFPFDGRRMRLESVGNAIDMSETVARNMLGAREAYVPKPWFWSDQYDLKLQIAGLGQGHDRIVVREGDGSRSHWYYRGDTLLAVDAMNAPRDYMVGKRLIEMRKSPEPAQIADPASDLKALLKA